jgi:hypothetical protein
VTTTSASTACGCRNNPVHWTEYCEAHGEARIARELRLGALYVMCEVYDRTLDIEELRCIVARLKANSELVKTDHRLGIWVVSHRTEILQVGTPPEVGML